MTAAESARLRGGVGGARSATSSPTQPASPRGTVIVEEDEVALPVPTMSNAACSVPAVPNGGAVIDGEHATEKVLDMVGTPVPCQPTPPVPNGSGLAPLASVEDETTELPVPAVDPSMNRSPSKENPFLHRFRQWTDRFALGKSAEASASSLVVGVEQPKSPRLGSRKVSHSLSRLFSWSCNRGSGSSSGGGATVCCNSPEPIQRSSGRRASKNTSDMKRKLSSSLDNLSAAHVDSTNHNLRNA